MHKAKQKLCCVDIGNTSIHIGKYHGQLLEISSKFETSEFLRDPSRVFNFINRHDSISYCSVVPSAEASLLNHLGKNSIVFNLNPKTCPSLPINYPNPHEIGADRLSNALAAFSVNNGLTIVVDIGTATTFDIITSRDGYCGGIIVPGPQGFLDFLHDNTALLPKIKLTQLDQITDQFFGKSTHSAMLLGVKHGYQPMLDGILQSITSCFNEEDLYKFEIFWWVGQ